jgi:hypothetical protein
MCSMVDGTGVTSIGDGSAPWHDVGVKQAGGWLRWIRTMCVFVGSGRWMLLKMLMTVISKMSSKLLLKLLPQLYPINMMTSCHQCIHCSCSKFHTCLPVNRQSNFENISAATVWLEAKAYCRRHRKYVYVSTSSAHPESFSYHRRNCIPLN